MSWAKVPISWSKDPRFSDELRVFLAICDQTRTKGSALFRPEMVLNWTKLSRDRVDAALKALIDFKAISIENGRVLVHASRACVDLTHDSNIDLTYDSKIDRRTTVGKHRSHAQAREKHPPKKIGFEDSFAERNRVATVRAKLLDEAKAFFSDKAWDQPRKRQRIGRKLMGICRDEMMPQSVREEIKEYVQTRAERQRKQIENVGDGKEY